MSEGHLALPVAARYLRSVHLQRDFAADEVGVHGYQVTPLVAQTTERIVEGLAPDATARAFSLIGPYGAGKSAYGVFLAHYLRSSPAMRQQMLAEHGLVGASAAITHGPMLLPVLVSGNNDSLRRAVLLVLHRALRSIKPLRDKRLRLPQVIAEASAVTDLDPQYVAQLVAEACTLVAERTAFRGLTVIIDELGQFLDYAARHDDERDLFVLQTLAEMAARSGATPCMLITILHQSFDRYTATAGAARRTEWTKVQGRYIDLPFQEPPVQMLRMVGSALTPERNDPFASARWEWAARIAPASATLRPVELSEEAWQRLVARAYPLHPTVLVALPLLFRQLAQNERSLFAFLTSHEPWSVQDVLRSAPADQPPIYRLPHLYAYVHATLGASLFARARGQRWAELAEARAQLASDDPLLLDVLTTIGTLGALGQTRELKANTAQITLALRDQLEDVEIERAVEELQARKHITYRQHRGSFVIWEGSDLDIDGMVHTARREIDGRVELVRLLQQHADTMPLVARRHSYQTGAVRYFAVRYIDAADLGEDVPLSDAADGEVLYVVPIDDEALGAAHLWAVQHARSTEPQRVVVLPERVRELRDLLLDVAALRHVLEHQQDLEGDQVARREVSSRLAEAQQMLTQVIAENYGPGLSNWYWRGRSVRVRSARQIDELLSEACDATYVQTPRIWNELIVRRQLSTAASKARRNLIEAMLEHPHAPLLGLTGYPPERAIYESVLHKSGMHRQEADGSWNFGPPTEYDPLQLRPTWAAIEQFFDASEGETQPVLALFDILEAPPYGVKAGLVPLLFMAAYMANVGDMALYEHGNYVPMPDVATFERLTRQPGYFAVRRSRATGGRAAVYERLARALAPRAMEKHGQAAILDAVTPLLRLVHTLPAYSRTTRQISPRAQAIRQALLAARAPDELLFERLPLACDLLPFPPDVALDNQQIEAFFTALREGLQELQNAYAALREEAREQIRAAFGALATESAALRAELTERYGRIANVTSDSLVRALGVRLENADMGEAWVESVAALVGRKPLDAWNDDDARSFALQIADLGRRFRTVEQIAVANQAVEPDAPIVRVGIANGYGEHSVIVQPTYCDEDMEQLRDELQEVLARYGTLTQEQRTSVLVALLQPLVEQIAGTNTNGHNDT